MAEAKMVDKRIQDLDALDTLASEDLIPVSDTSVGGTAKKMTGQQLMTYALSESKEQISQAVADATKSAQEAQAGAEEALGKVQAIVAGNEAHTKEEDYKLFARALVTETGKGTSHEIYPDPKSPVVVTAFGFTEQEGEGDPSKDNIRPIKVAESVSVSVGDDTFSPELNDPLCEGDYITSKKDGQCVEYHNSTIIALTGGESFENHPNYTGVFRARLSSAAGASPNTVCSHIKVYKTQGELQNNRGLYCSNNSVFVVIGWPEGVDDLKSYLSEQYEAGTPVTVSYQLGTPVTHTSDPIEFVAKPDSTGKVVISGESVSAVYNKSLSKAFEELSNAILKLGGTV